MTILLKLRPTLSKRHTYTNPHSRPARACRFFWLRGLDRYKISRVTLGTRMTNQQPAVPHACVQPYRPVGDHIPRSRFLSSSNLEVTGTEFFKNVLRDIFSESVLHFFDQKDAPSFKFIGLQIF